MLETGTVLQNRYAIDGVVGSGGMGRVYLARQTLLGGRRVALKEVAFDHGDVETREVALAAFRQEAQTLSALSHPNLVDVKDFFEDEGRVYLVMDFVDGTTLEEIANGHPLPVAQVLEYSHELASVLAYLHNSDPPIIFRDLKPANIMQDTTGHIRVVDFGLAKVLDGSPARPYITGTPGYAPIEQLLSLSLPADERSDIYGLGATLYFLLTGQTPPHAGSRLDEDALRPPHETVPETPLWLSTGIVRMMALRPEDRFQNILQVQAMLAAGQARPAHDVPKESDLTPLRLEGHLRDILGRRYPVRLLNVDNARVRFACALPRLVVQPRELFFHVPGTEEAVPVSFRLLDQRAGRDTSIFDVELLSPPLSVYRILRARRSSWRVICPTPLQCRFLKRKQTAQVIDLSATGCRLVSAAPTPLGEPLPLRLSLGDPRLPDIDVSVQVCWSKVRPDHQYESGVILMHSGPESRDVLELYLEQAEARRPG
ncbi:MAG TPA: serine/threonine-protein kinase [Candidatus Xenobia bacterium]